VTDVANIFDVTISAASQQLRVLEMLGPVRKTRTGQMVCYEPKKESYRQATHAIYKELNE
jgi:5-enolpyruvylshikimate-3-phosphate synthase